MLQITNPVSEAESLQRESKAEVGVWTESMLSALKRGVKGGKWFSLIDKVYSKQTLTKAWKRVKANRGSYGVDKQSIAKFNQDSESYIQELSEALKQGSYKPSGIREVKIPKTDGSKRALGIPTVKDRIVQKALCMAIEPIFEHEFHAESYGFRPGRSAKDALRSVEGYLKQGYHWVVDADIQGYFDNIDQVKLMKLVEEKISDSKVLLLIESYLSQPIHGATEVQERDKGTPQGGVISPLLANIYLNELDYQLNSRYRMVRYADDFILLCRSQAEAAEALELVREWMQRQGLELHPKKTKIVDEQAEDGVGFDFLGYSFKRGKHYVSQKSYKSIKAKIRERTKRHSGKSMKRISQDLNPILRGWYGYFKHTSRGYILKVIDRFTRRRLRSIYRAYDKKGRGTGRTLGDHLRWRNNHFIVELGLFTLYEAFRLESQSRC